MELVDKTTLYILILLIAALGMLLIALVTFYLQMVKKYTKLLEEFTKAKRTEREAVDQLYADAQHKAQRFVEEARLSAQALMREATTLNESDKKALEQIVTETQKQYAVKYEELLGSFEKKSDAAFAHLSDDVKQYIIKEMESFQVALAQELKNFHTIAQERFVGAYTKMEQEVDLIKDQRLRRLDERIISVVEDISQDVLGKEISIDEHEKLILKSLEEAKKEHVF